MRPLQIAPLVLLLVPGCWPSVSEEISDRFIAVNDSLEAARASTEQRAGSQSPRLPSVPFAELGCPEFQRRMDSLALALEFAAHASAPFFADLTGVPQEDSRAGERCFSNEGHGQDLFTAITRAYAVAAGIVTDDSTRTRIEQMRLTSFPYDSPGEWRSADFAGVPRAEVITLLSKSQRELDELRTMCDNALLKACLAKR